MPAQKRVYQSLEVLNQKEDPWSTKHPYNQKTFTDLIALIESVPHASILEVGCAQGAFTAKLTQISNDVTAIDVSSSAIEQARKRVPNAKFHTTTLEAFAQDKQYDVIVCAEVLYYIKDRKKAIAKLQRLGKYLVTSQYIFCFPQLSWGSIKYEWSLQKFQTIKRMIATYPNPLTLTIRTLRKL